MGYAERTIIGVILIISAYEIYRSCSQRYHFHRIADWGKNNLNFSLQSSNTDSDRLLGFRSITKDFYSADIYKWSCFNL